MRYKHLNSEIKSIKPKTILEIGTWNGEHSISMINTALSFNDEVEYYGFDIFEGINEDVRKKELHTKNVENGENVKNKIKSKTKAKINIHVGYTKDTLPKFKPDKPIDFIYIDGGHSLETIQGDWDGVKEFMHKGTVVIFDDYYESANKEEVGCYNLITELSNNPKYKVELLGPADTFPGLKIKFAKVQLS
jgi:predicted O-methyltransferase YrrM